MSAQEGDPYEDVPENMRDWLKTMPTRKPEAYEEGVTERWQWFEEGKCMCCSQKLGTYTTVILNASGLEGVFCTGVCATDIANLGFVQELYDDIQERIKFRGGSGDVPEE